MPGRAATATRKELQAVGQFKARFDKHAAGFGNLAVIRGLIRCDDYHDGSLSKFQAPVGPR